MDMGGGDKKTGGWPIHLAHLSTSCDKALGTRVRGKVDQMVIPRVNACLSINQNLRIKPMAWAVEASKASLVGH